MLGFTTVRAGERVAVWDRAGRVEVVDGPRRLRNGGRVVQRLARHAAGPEQYLVVRFTDGHAQHVHGPAAVWLHPVEHASVTVHEAVHLDANEVLVVYAQQPERVTRRVVRGPSLFMPAANEWLHEFVWHGADPADHGRKVPYALRFTKLRVIPDQTYFDVRDVRTADDALLVVQLMIFFELTCIETMLDQTHDPVADFVNAVSADVIAFTAGRSFERFKEETAALNDLAAYPQLAARATRIGYRVNKVVYRGYHASPKLQGMHDGAIEARTRLRLEAETENQAQALADLKLAREADRAAQRREMEEADLHHRNRLARLAHDERLRKLAAERDARLRAEQARRGMRLEHQRARGAERLAFLQAMRAAGVDLTRYLVSRHQHPDRVIRIDGNDNGLARLHLHDSAG